MSHDNIVIQNKLKSNNITSSDVNSNFITTYWNPNEISITNMVGNGGVINIGNKEHPEQCTIYLYGRVVHLVNTPNDGFFDEVDGFLQQLGI